MEDNNSRESKKPNLRILIFIPIAAMAVFVFVSLQNRNPPAVDIEPVHAQKGPQAPNFTLPGLDGRMVSLSDYRGKVVLLNIWATWCPPCVAETPSLDRLYKMFKDEDFELLAVSVDEGGKKVVEDFMKKKNLSFPVLLDPQGYISGLYRTTGVPESFIIRKDGTIDNKIQGAIDWTGPKAIEYFNKLIQEPVEGSI
jgi:peroxiredoxin